MAEVRYDYRNLPPITDDVAGYLRVGLPPGSPGTPGINPAAPDPRGRPSFWDTLWGVLTGDVAGRQRPGTAEEAVGQPKPERAKEQEKAAEEAAGQPATNFCFGADKVICEGMGAARGICYILTNLTCIALGIIILLALLGIGLHAIVT
jgi:hypothetical protein